MSVNTLQGISNVYPIGDHEIFVNAVGSLETPILLNGTTALNLGGQLEIVNLIGLKGPVDLILFGEPETIINLIGKYDPRLNTIRADYTNILSDITNITIDRI
jgi:hypothetical protein